MVDTAGALAGKIATFNQNLAMLHKTVGDDKTCSRKHENRTCRAMVSGQCFHVLHVGCNWRCAVSSLPKCQEKDSRL